MRIGEIAERTGLNINNIRFYERKGLLCPNREDEIRNLKSSAELCQMLLHDGDPVVNKDQIDQYLDYVYQEEEKGVRFAEVEGLLDVF